MIHLESFNIGADSFREVYVILNRLNLYNRIPKEIQDYIEENQNIQHKFDFNEKIPLYEQLDNEGTKGMLTYLFIKYINTNHVDAQNIKREMIELMKK